MSHFANFGGFGESFILGHLYSFVTRRSTRNQLAVTEPPHLRTSSKLNATISHHAKPGDGGCNTSGAMSQWDVVRPCQPPEILALQTGPMCGASESLRSRAKMPVSKGIQRIPKAVPVHFLFCIGPNKQSSKFPLGLEHIVNMLKYIDLHKLKHFTASRKPQTTPCTNTTASQAPPEPGTLGIGPRHLSKRLNCCLERRFSIRESTWAFVCNTFKPGLTKHI